MNYVDGLLVVVAIAFLAVRYFDIPIQAVPKDASSQAEHLIDQMLIFVGIVPLKHNNHWECEMLIAAGHGSRSVEGVQGPLCVTKSMPWQMLTAFYDR